MKPTVFAIIITLPLAAAIIGCGKSEQTQAPPPPPAVTQTPKPAEQPKPAPPVATETPATSVIQKVTEAATGKYANLLNAFQGADAGTLANVQKAVTAMEAGKWLEALPLLQQLLSGDLTAAQKQAVQDSIAQSQKESVASAVPQAVPEAPKAVDDLKKGLPFGK